MIKKGKLKIDLKKILKTSGSEIEENQMFIDQLYGLSCRKLADIGVGFMKSSKITPNQITVVRSLIFLPVIFYLFLQGTFIGNLAGIFCALVNSVFDHLDGNLARMKSLTSRLGAWLDSTLDGLLLYVTLIGIILGSYRATQDEVLLIAGIFVLFSHGFLKSLSNQFEKNLEDNIFTDFQLKKVIYNDKKSTLLDKIYLNILGFHSAWSYFFFTIRYPILVGAIFNVMTYVVFYWVIAINFRLVFLCLIYARVLEKKQSNLLFINELKKRLKPFKIPSY